MERPASLARAVTRWSARSLARWSSRPRFVPLLIIAARGARPSRRLPLEQRYVGRRSDEPASDGASRGLRQMWQQRRWSTDRDGTFDRGAVRLQRIPVVLG